MSRYIPKPRIAMTPGTRVVVLAAAGHCGTATDPAEVVADDGAGVLEQLAAEGVPVNMDGLA